MNSTFRLYWLREAACDAGTEVRAEELEPSVRQRVVDLARGGDCMVRLPFLDRKDWRKRDEILSSTPLERVGDLIRAVLDHGPATRDAAATCVLTDPAWQNLPKPDHADYFRTWQRVSLALQRGLRKWIAAEYFENVARYEDRATGYPVLAYRASRLCYGRPRTEFTFDLRDYPDCTATLAGAMRLTGRATQAALADAEQRLMDEGRPELARRYAPVWFEDVLVAARKRPKIMIELLARESAVINAVIDLGSDPTVAMINRTSRVIQNSLRNVLGLDMRKLGCAVLEETTRVLASVNAADSSDHFVDAGADQDLDAGAAGSPHARVGR